MRRLMLLLVLLLSLIGSRASVMGQDNGEHPVITPENAAQITQVGEVGESAPWNLVWSPDGNRLAFLNSSGLHLYDAAAFEGEMSLPDHSLSSFAFNADSSMLAVGTENGAVQLRETSTGQIVDTIEGLDGLGSHVTLSPDGTMLAAAVSNETVQLWDLTTSALRFEWEVVSVEELSFSLDGTTLLSVTRKPSNIQRWDTQTGEQLSIVELGYGVGWVGHAFSPDSTLAAWLDWARFGLVDAATGESIWMHEGFLDPSPSLESITFSLDGELLALSDSNGLVTFWDAKSGDERPGRFHHGISVTDLAFSPDAVHLAFEDDTGAIWVYDMNTDERQLVFQGYSGGAYTYALAFSPDGTRITAARVDNIAWQWDVASGELLTVGVGTQYYEGFGMNPYNRCIALSSDTRLLASGSAYDGLVRLWRPSGERRGTLETGQELDVFSVAFSGEGTLLAASTDRIFIWETQLGKVQIVLKSHGAVESMAFSPSGAVLATGMWNGAILLRDVQSGVVLAQLDGHTGAVNTLSFSPDGKLLASGGAFTPDFKSDNTVRLWSVATGQQLFVLEGHADWVTDVAFNPAGTVLASAGGDTVRLWDVATGDELAVFEGYRSIAWSPDGTLLAAEGRNNTMRLWGVP